MKSPPVAHSEQARTVDIEGATTHEEELQTKPRSPLTILSEDEGYLLEDEQQIFEQSQVQRHVETLLPQG